jgi:hypothetical protein
LAALAEWGFYATFKVLPRVTLKAGYEFWWLYGVAIAFENVEQSLTPLSGNGISSDGDIFYHGGTVGCEVVW